MQPATPFTRLLQTGVAEVSKLELAKDGIGVLATPFLDRTSRAYTRIQPLLE